MHDLDTDRRNSHAAALDAASATAGRKKTWRVILLALGAAGTMGVSTANAGTTDNDDGTRLVQQAKGCFAWGPPAPPVFA